MVKKKKKIPAFKYSEQYLAFAISVCEINDCDTNINVQIYFKILVKRKIINTNKLCSKITKIYFKNDLHDYEYIIL